MTETEILLKLLEAGPAGIAAIIAFFIYRKLATVCIAIAQLKGQLNAIIDIRRRNPRPDPDRLRRP